MEPVKLNFTPAIIVNFVTKMAEHYDADEQATPAQKAICHDIVTMVTIAASLMAPEKKTEPAEPANNQ